MFNRAGGVTVPPCIVLTYGSLICDGAPRTVLTAVHTPRNRGQQDFETHYNKTQADPLGLICQRLASVVESQ